MREYSTPPSMDPPTTGNLTDDVVANAHEAADRTVFLRRPPPAASWSEVTAAAVPRSRCAPSPRG